MKTTTKAADAAADKDRDGHDFAPPQEAADALVDEILACRLKTEEYDRQQRMLARVGAGPTMGKNSGVEPYHTGKEAARQEEAVLLRALSHVLGTSAVRAPEEYIRASVDRRLIRSVAPVVVARSAPDQETEQNTA